MSSKKKRGYAGFPMAVDAPSIPLCDRIVTVVRIKYSGETTAMHFIPDNPDMMLSDIKTEGADIVVVIAEDALDGVVYRWGNRNSNLGKYWEQIGTTCGYA